MVKSGLSVKKVAVFACLFAFAIAGSGMVEAKKKDYVLTLNGFVGGKLIFPQIELWSAPGGPAIGAKVVERLRSGTKVKIVGSVVFGQTPWYLVTSFGPVEAKSGWVPEHFLRLN